MQQEADASSGISPLAWSLAGILIVAVAIVFRLFDLELKPLHHDEGVNGLFVMRLMEPPYRYRYDPARFHGPTLYYLAKPVALTVGLTTFAIRFVPALCGIAIVLLAIYLRPWIGSAGSLAAAALIAVSPGAIYFSRYFIHESLLVFFTFGTVVAAWHYVEKPRAIVPGARLNHGRAHVCYQGDGRDLGWRAHHRRPGDTTVFGSQAASTRSSPGKVVTCLATRDRRRRSAPARQQYNKARGSLDATC